MSASAPLRIAFVVPDFEPLLGGTTRQAGNQARALARRGHRVQVVTRRRQTSMPRHEVREGLPVLRLAPGGWGDARDKLALLAVAAWLRRSRRDLDVVQILMQGDLATAARLAGVVDRTWITWAGLGDATDLLARPDGFLRRAQWAYRRAALQRCRHVALTEPMAAELRRVGLQVEAEIPVPVDGERFRPPTEDERAAARRAIGAGADALVVVYIGHLRRLKAVDRLVEAFARVVAGREAMLLLVGGGRGADDDTESELREQVRVLGIGERVQLVGAVDDVRPFLWAADVFVLPSEREGMPNTLVEAMATSVACVAPASAGGDVLLGGGAGIVPPSNDPDDLAAAIEALVDPGVRAACVAAANAQIRRFDLEAVTTAYEATYRRGA
jgi:glycosyltransferase involved in cell wall biosynthesis